MLKYQKIDNNKDEWVVFVHGIAGSTETWKKQIEDFSKYFNLLLVDLPGHGDNASNIVDKVSVPKLNTDIKETLDNVGIEQAYFVGMSLGTLVISAFAVAYPQYVKSIVFGGAVLCVCGVYKMCMWLANTFKKCIPYKCLYRFFCWFMMPRKNHLISRSIFLREAVKLNKSTMYAWIEYLSNCLHSDFLIKGLENTHIHVFFISGSEDRCFIKGVKKTFDFIKNSDFNLIEHCGHVCSIEKYTEFNRLALNYLML